MFQKPAQSQAETYVDLSIEVEVTTIILFTVRNQGTAAAYDATVDIELADQVNNSPDRPQFKQKSSTTCSEKITGTTCLSGVWTVGKLEPGKEAIFGLSPSLARGLPCCSDPNARYTVPFRAVVKSTVPGEEERFKGDNTVVDWVSVKKSTGSSKAVLGRYWMKASVDDLLPEAGDTVNFSFEFNTLTGFTFLREVKVTLELDAGMGIPTASTLPMGTTFAAAPGLTRTWDWNIGTPARRPLNLVVSTTLDDPLPTDVARSDLCLDAKVTARPGKNISAPTSAEICLREDPVTLLQAGETHLFTLYPCVGVSTYPCSSSDTVGMVVNGGASARAAGIARDNAIMDPGNVVVHVKDPQGRVKTGSDRRWSSADTGLSTSIDGSRLSSTDWSHWLWKVASVQLPTGGNLSITPDSNRAFSLVHTGNKAQHPPGGLTALPDVLKGVYSTYIVFENLGTYTIDFTQVTTNNRGTTTTTDDMDYEATGRYTFHVGPVAELEVRDHGASRDVPLGQRAFTIVADNNGPDDAPAVQVTVTGMNADDYVSHSVTAGSFDSATGVWTIGELREPRYQKEVNRRDGEVLTIVTSAAAGSEITAAITNTQDYSVCIDSAGDDVELPSDSSTKMACTNEDSSNTWHTAKYYDHISDNNSAAIRGQAGTGANLPALLEPKGSLETIIAVEWEDVKTVNGVDVERYEAQKWAPTKSKWETQDSEIKGTVWVDLEPGEDPQYRMRAVNELGVPGPWSEPVFGKRETVTVAGVEVDLDPDTDGIQLERTVDEGTEIEYTIKLKSQPTYDVHIYVNAGAGVTVVPPPISPSRALPATGDTGNLIIFSRDDWNEPKEVTVRIDESLEIDDDGREVKIGHRLSATSLTNRIAEYAGVTVPDLTLTVNDTTRRKAGFKSLGKKTLLVETGKSEAYTIRPIVAPTNDVTITLTLTPDTPGVEVATIDTDADTPGNQNTIIFGFGDFFPARETLPDGTVLYARPARRGVPGAVTVTGVSAGEANITVTDVSGDPYFSVASAAAAAQAVKVDKPKPTVTAPSFSAETLPDQTATVGEAFSYSAPAATDPNGEALSYEASLSDGGEMPGWLSFDTSTRAFAGTPQVCDAPATLPITVTATDDGALIPQTATTAFTLTVTGTLPWHWTVSKEDYNDYHEKNGGDPVYSYYNRPPMFLDGESTTRSLRENSGSDIKVGAPVLACDPDGDALKYLYLDGADSAAFKLDEETGQLTTKSGASFDFETKRKYEFNVIVEEQGTKENYLSQIRVTVNLIDDPLGTEVAPVNRPPTFDSGIATILTLPENSAAGTKVGGPISATDPDGHTLTYSLSGDDAASFAIGTSTGQLTTRSEVTYDYEDKRWYSVGVTAHDGNGGRIRTYLQVGLTDVNEAPDFGASSATRSVAENSAAGTKVGAAVTATDPDSDALSYSLAGADATSFAIGTSTGQLTTRPGIEYDYESEKKSYSLTVTASDKANLTDSIEVTVNLTDVEEQGPPLNRAPVFATSSIVLSVEENSAAGTKVGVAVTATDPDNDTLSYSLSGTDASSFEIGETTGQITTKAGETYDYENKKSYSLTVEASDGGGGAASVAVTINLTNVNEAPVFAASSIVLSVEENSAAGTSVGAAVTATDPDNDTLSYSLSGTDASSFEIGETTGQITTKSGETYDYESKNSYSLTVGVSDAGGLTDSISVTVNVTTACFTTIVELSSTTVEYARAWDDAECSSHHQDSLARYFQFTPDAETEVTISLSAGVLYVSKDLPQNEWGTVPGRGYEHRRAVRRNNGGLAHDGLHVATAEDDGNTVTLTMEAGMIYTMEAAQTDDGEETFSISVARAAVEVRRRPSFHQFFHEPVPV